MRVPRAWGDGGEPMVEAAALPLDFPEVAVVEEDTLAMQTLAVASDLPEVPLVLGGCCCSHIGAVEGLAARFDRLGVIWLDAHGDLNTPETSPSGNEWGMPLRMIIDQRRWSRRRTSSLCGARNLDPPEAEFIARTGSATTRTPVLERADGVYVALDLDVLEPGELAVFMPEPGGPTLDDVEQFLARVRESGARRRRPHGPRARSRERREARAPGRGARPLKHCPESRAYQYDASPARLELSLRPSRTRCATDARRTGSGGSR